MPTIAPSTRPPARAGDLVQVTASAEELTRLSIPQEEAADLSGRLLIVRDTQNEDLNVASPTSGDLWWVRQPNVRRIIPGDRLRVPPLDTPGMPEPGEPGYICATDMQRRESTILHVTNDRLSFRCLCGNPMWLQFRPLITGSAAIQTRDTDSDRIVSRRPPQAVRKATVSVLPLP